MKLLITLIFSFTTFIGICQSDYQLEISKGEFKAKQVIGPSPDAAELGKYGNVPVSLFTGTPTISVPLYELKGNSLSLPISLSYNASGFKPEDISPWVGSGWSLNAGGVITRSVIGNPDGDTYFTSANHLSFSGGTIIDLRAFADSLKNEFREAQPDVYYYNFAGHSGKFYIKPDGSIHKKEKDMNYITFNCMNCGSNGALTSFTIADDKGVTYTFAAVEMSNLNPMDDGGAMGLSYIYPSSWYLTQIKSADTLETIDFDYYYTTSAQGMYTNTKQNESRTRTFSETPTCFNTYSTTETTYGAIPANTGVKKRFLNKITLKRNGVTIAYVDVVSSTGRQDTDFSEDRKVDQVKVYSTESSNVLVKQFNLSLGYFVNTNNIFVTKRMRLDSVQEIAVDGVTANKPPYIFTYNYDAGSMPMPDRYTTALDHWGFFNGATSNSSLIPSITIAYPNGRSSLTMGAGADREPNLAATTCTILSKVTYPTGGYTTFEYELNQGTDDNYVLHTIGGLRVKKITDYSFDTKKATVKNYQYTLNNGNTSGRMGTFPKYYKMSRYTSYFIPHFCPCDQCADRDLTTVTYSLSTNSIYPLGTIQGAHVGYSQVTEYQSEASNDYPLGKTVYKYSIGNFMEHDEDISGGDLLEQSTYNSSDKLLEQITNTYQTLDLDFISAVFAKPEDYQSNKTYWITDGTQYIKLGDWESIPSGWTHVATYTTLMGLETYEVHNQSKVLTQQTQKIYDQLSNSYITNTKKFTYKDQSVSYNYTYPTKIEQSTTGDEVVITEKKYAGDYTYGSGDDNALGIANLTGYNVWSAEVESVQYRQKTDGSNKRYISGSIIGYHPSRPYPARIYRLETATPLSSLTGSAISSNVFTYDSHYKLAGTFSYNSYGNLIEQTKADDITTSYIWGYNHSYPVAQVVGASSSSAMSYVTDATLQSMSTSESTIRSQVNSIRSNLSTAMVTAYTYKPLKGMSSQVDPNGRATYFEYDGLGRTTFVKDNDGNIVKNFKYNYGLGSTPTASTQTLFYSHERSGTFTKSTSCTSGGTYLPSITYKVGYGKYVSYAGQSVVDGQADDDYNNNGQAAADAAPCLYGNALYRPWYQKNDCALTQGQGNLIRYVVAAGTFKAATQAEADQMAIDDAHANAQNYANVTAACSCGEDYQMYINDSCETGTRVNMGAYQDGLGRWWCTYKYQFSDRYSILFEELSDTCPLSN